MDFQYTFRQSNQDRLEDAGYVRYQPTDGFNVLKAKRSIQQHIFVQQLRPIFAALVSIFVK